MSHSILRVEKVNNPTTTKALQRHNQRENKNYENKDIDLNITYLNYDLINENDIQYTDEIEKTIEAGYTQNRKIRSDAIKHVDGIITSDKAFFDSLPSHYQEQYFKDSLDFLKKEYGQENLLYATVHLDEKTPHMHFGFVPITEDGRLSAKKIVGNKKDLSELQDRFNDFVNEKGYNLERGERGSDAEHLDMQEYKAKTLNEKVNDLENEVQSLEKNLNSLQNVEQRIIKLDEFDDKVKVGWKKVTMSKDDYESFKSVAKSGIATLDKYEELKASNSNEMQKLQEQKMNVENERDQVMDENEKLVTKNQNLSKENKELKRENTSLQQQLERFKNCIINFKSKLRENMKELVKKIGSPSLYKDFEQEVFNSSEKHAHEENQKELKNNKQNEKQNEKDQLEL